MWEELLVDAGIAINGDSYIEISGQDINVRQLPGIDAELEELHPDEPDEVLVARLLSHRLLNQAG